MTNIRGFSKRESGSQNRKKGEMKAFALRDVEEAIVYAKKGYQALHLHNIIVTNGAPRCFVAAINRGEPIAHLFDLNLTRLKKTAKELGVNIVFVDKEGTSNQHVDLCGKPLKKAIQRCVNKGKAERIYASFASSTKD